MENPVQHVAAKISVATSMVGALTAWLDVVDTAVQIGAGLVAIVSGVYALRYYRRRYLLMTFRNVDKD